MCMFDYNTTVPHISLDDRHLTSCNLYNHLSFFLLSVLNIWKTCLVLCILYMCYTCLWHLRFWIRNHHKAMHDFIIIITIICRIIHFLCIGDGVLLPAWTVLAAAHSWRVTCVIAGVVPVIVKKLHNAATLTKPSWFTVYHPCLQHVFNREKFSLIISHTHICLGDK